MNDAHCAETVTVDLGDRSYDILIGPGLLEQSGRRIAETLPGVRAAIVTDENVAAHHLETVRASLADAGIDATDIVLPAGEPTKRFEILQDVVYRILDARLERGDERRTPELLPRRRRRQLVVVIGRHRQRRR